MIASIKTTATSGLGVNAVGYNMADNYMYAHDGQSSLVRIYVDGTTDTLVTLPKGYVGDVDNNGYYWLLSSTTSEVYQVDVDYTRSTYLQIISTTAYTIPQSISILDWAYVPGGGSYLWAVGSRSTDLATGLIGFNTQTLAFEIRAIYTDVRVNGGFAEQFAVGDGSLYAIDDNTGDLWKFSLTSSEYPDTIFQGGPTFTNNDGARCASNVAT